MEIGSDRRVYRFVVGTAGLYYYLSLPIILISAIALPLAIGYAALSTPYLNLVLLAVILIGGIGGIVTAFSGLRTAVVRIPDSPEGTQLKREESPRFWSLVESVADEVVRKLKDRMETLIVGDPMDKNTDIGAINSAEQLETIEKYLAQIDPAVPLTNDTAIMTSGCFHAQALARQMLELSQSIGRCEVKLAELMQTHPDAPLFTALPGAAGRRPGRRRWC